MRTDARSGMAELVPVRCDGAARLKLKRDMALRPPLTLERVP